MADAVPTSEQVSGMARLVVHVSGGGLDLTNRQAAILMLVCWSPLRGRATVRALAGALGIAKPVVTRAADTLSNLGLVKRVRDPNDGRNVFIVATAAGREAVQELPYG